MKKIKLHLIAGEKIIFPLDEDKSDEDLFTIDAETKHVFFESEGNEHHFMLNQLISFSIIVKEL